MDHHNISSQRISGKDFAHEGLSAKNNISSPSSQQDSIDAITKFFEKSLKDIHEGKNPVAIYCKQQLEPHKSEPHRKLNKSKKLAEIIQEDIYYTNSSPHSSMEKGYNSTHLVSSCGIPDVPTKKQITKSGNELQGSNSLTYLGPQFQTQTNGNEHILGFRSSSPQQHSQLKTLRRNTSYAKNETMSQQTLNPIFCTPKLGIDTPIVNKVYETPSTNQESQTPKVGIGYQTPLVDRGCQTPAPNNRNHVYRTPLQKVNIISYAFSRPTSFLQKISEKG